jgi:hypothetical protein
MFNIEMAEKAHKKQRGQRIACWLIATGNNRPPPARSQGMGKIHPL